jgi:hypothetical protein
LETALPSNATRLKASRYVAEIAADWNAMSNDEKQKASQETMEQLKSHHENKRFNRHNLPVNALHDTSTTLDAMEQEVIHHTLCSHGVQLTC